MQRERERESVVFRERKWREIRKEVKSCRRRERLRDCMQYIVKLMRDSYTFVPLSPSPSFSFR